MRPSSYLNTVEIGDGNSLLYNGFSMCIDVVPSGVARLLAASVEGEDISFLSPAEKEHLVKRGHLTTLTKAAERAAMGRLANALAKSDAELDTRPLRGKMITFVLTYRCNLSCAYCYQSEVRKTAGSAMMDPAFLDNFFRNYLDKALPAKGAGDLSFLLYGGEPLLPGNRAAIERILSYAGEHRVGVFTVTNGVMLPGMIDLIGPEKGKINNVQVTLDGGRNFHDEQRVSRSGGPTFEQTIGALREVMKTGANAVIRVHLHPRRLESARELVEYLDREKILGDESVKVYFWSTEELDSVALSPEEYSVFSRLFEDVALKQCCPPTAHFAFLEQILEMKTARNRPVRRRCDTCVAGLHCVVDALGDVYECIDDAGHTDRRVGVLSGGAVRYLEGGESRRRLHISDKPDCLKCSVALYCGGGCTNRLKAQNDSRPDAFCLQVKDFIALTLKSHFLLRQAGKTGAGIAPAC